MQPMITAVQNAVSPREIGVATGAVTFFRSMGGTLGTAVFLSVLFNVLPGNIKDAYAGAAKDPEFLKAAADPAQQQLLAQAQGGGGLSDTSFINKLTDVVAHPFKVGFSDSVHVVYLMAFFIMLVGLVIVLFLPEIPLSMRSAQQQRAEDAAQAEKSAGVPGPGAGPAVAAGDEENQAEVKAGSEGPGH
jgi:hypothetical protein